MNLDARKVKGVQDIALNALVRTKDFDVAHMIFGLAELVGRLIAKQTPGTWIQKKEIMEAAQDHMELATRAGTEGANDEKRIITLN